MKVGLYDADLMDGGTRHPNLTLMKLSTYFQRRGDDVKLLLDDEEDDFEADEIYVSKVFSKTKDPSFIENEGVYCGGTGYYADDPRMTEGSFRNIRAMDMEWLIGALSGYDPKTIMPDYHLYDGYIDLEELRGVPRSKYADYLDYSIGFLTRGCVRHCPFCVNRYENSVQRYSPLKAFHNPSRPYIYLWDDNILAANPLVVEECFAELNSLGKPFQFRQGLDIRMMDTHKANLLNNSRYKGDYIFAFDQWKDREIIERKLQLWREICSKNTKLYLFCGFRQNGEDELFFDDILCLFKRIEILMRYKCLGYVMRHVDYLNSPMPNMYVQIARWVNQPNFYKKMSFREYIESCQKYVKTKVCKPIETFDAFCHRYSTRLGEINKYFDLKYEY